MVVTSYFLQLSTNEVSMQTCFLVFCCGAAAVAVVVNVVVVVDLNETGFISRETRTKRESEREFEKDREGNICHKKLVVA